MRLKENRNNWRAGAVIKRDFRHDVVEPKLSFRSKKPTNRWCRGKPGIQHNVAWENSKDWFGFSYRTGTCSLCGKNVFGRAATIE